MTGARLVRPRRGHAVALHPRDHRRVIRTARGAAELGERDAALADRWRDAVATTLGALVSAGRTVRGFTSTATYVVD